MDGECADLRCEFGLHGCAQAAFPCARTGEHIVCALLLHPPMMARKDCAMLPFASRPIGDLTTGYSVDVEHSHAAAALRVALPCPLGRSGLSPELDG